MRNRYYQEVKYKMKYYRILLVDDEPHIINMIMRLLDSIENMELDIYYA